MATFPTMLVALGLDSRDEMILQRAVRVAAAAGTEQVHLAHFLPGYEQPLGEEVQQSLRSVTSRAQRMFPESMHLDCIAEEGDPVSTVIRVGIRTRADVIVVGANTSGHPDIRHAATCRLIRKSPCSVLVVPNEPVVSTGEFLVPVDFSEDAVVAFKMALAIAAGTPGARIKALHVYSVPTGYHKTGKTYEEFAEMMRGQALESWTRFKNLVDFSGVAVEPMFRESERIPSLILQLGEDREVELVVLGSHGRTAAAAFLLGHVADMVACRTTRPLLVTKARGKVIGLVRALLQLYELD